MIGLAAAVLVVATAAAHVRTLGLLRRRWFRRALSGASVCLAVLAGASVLHPLYTNVQAGRLQQELVEGFGSPAHRAAYEECERFGFEHPRCRIGEGDGLTRIRIERIGLDVVVVEGVGDAALRAGAGHYPTTAHPCAAGNVGIAGHRTTYGQPFHHLDRLHAGDEIVLETPLTECRYVVSGQEVVGPRDVRVVAPTSDDRLTLTTCHPKGSSRQRLVVHALLIA